MRFRLLRRRLTISAPSMAIRSHMPWPLRWAIVAVVFGFCAAIGLWAFEFGKDIAGLDRNAKEEVNRLKDDVERLRQDRDKARSDANSSTSLITAERSAQEALMGQLKALEAENRQLRDDLGFYEKLIPPGANEGLTIRGLTADLSSPGQLKWQFLVVMPLKNAPQFNGKYVITLAGVQQLNKPWTLNLAPQDLSFKQLGRMQGVVDLPPAAVPRTITLKILEGNTQKAIHTIKI
jgi:hypothetical protein